MIRSSRATASDNRQSRFEFASHSHLQVVITKEACTIVGDGRTQREVEARVKQIRNVVENTEQEYEREKLNERIARLSGGVAIIQVCYYKGSASRRPHACLAITHIHRLNPLIGCPR